MRWAGHVARVGGGRGAYSVLVRRFAGKRPLGRSRHWWDDSMKMNFRRNGMEMHGLDWSGSGEVRVAGCC